MTDPRIAPLLRDIFAALPDGDCGHGYTVSGTLHTADGRAIPHEWVATAEIARLRAIEEAARFPRNTVIRDGTMRLKGEWVAVPKADFDALRAALGSER